MTDSPTIGRARRAARALSRTEGLSHQQALDRVASEAGHAHWSAMLRADADGGRPADAATVAFPHLRNPCQSDSLRWMQAHSPRAVVTAAMAALAILPMEPRLVAQAVDHQGGPWDDDDAISCRCPVHDDRNPSLLLQGRGSSFVARCAAGCPDAEVVKAITKGIAAAARKALTFKAANDRHGVYAGASTGQGGMGGRYSLDSGRGYDLDTLTCRLLPDGYPRWNFD